MGLTQVEMAKQLNITKIQLSKIENDRSMPSARTIQRYREVSGIDPYVFDWCRNPDIESLPKEVRSAASELHQIWHEALEE